MLKCVWLQDKFKEMDALTLEYTAKAAKDANLPVPIQCLVTISPSLRTCHGEIPGFHLAAAFNYRASKSEL